MLRRTFERETSKTLKLTFSQHYCDYDGEYDHDYSYQYYDNDY